MRKVILTLLFLFGMCSVANAQLVSRKQDTFDAVENGGTIKLIGSGASYHKLSWNKVGTVTVCSIKVQQSSTGAWAGEEADLITTQDCSSNGTTAIVGGGTPNYARIITHTTFTGTGSVVAVYTGYLNDPTGGGGTPGGSSGQIQFNNAGAFGGRATSGSGVTVPIGTFTSPATGNAMCYESGDWVPCAVKDAFGFILGADDGSALADTADQASIFINWTENSQTIEEIYCECDGGTPTVNFQRDDGSAANILSSALTVTTTGACARATAVASTIDSAVTCVATLDATEKILSAGHRVDWLTVTAGGVAKRITCWGKYAR